PAPRHRRLGARLLPQVPEQASRLPRGLVERRELAGGRAAFRGGAELARVADCTWRCCNPERGRMRKNKGDMELALEVPQPRLRAVPSEPAPPPPSPDASDAELLARVGEHDREAFELLYGRYVRPVFSL